MRACKVSKYVYIRRAIYRHSPEKQNAWIYLSLTGSFSSSPQAKTYLPSYLEQVSSSTIDLLPRRSRTVVNFIKEEGMYLERLRKFNVLVIRPLDDLSKGVALLKKKDDGGSLKPLTRRDRYVVTIYEN